MSEICAACRRPKAKYACALCQASLCKDCEEFLPADTFAFQPELPENLTHTHYCQSCHDSEVRPAIEKYEETLDLARGVYVFFTTQKRQPAVLKRSQEKVQIKDCDDRDETILRLAFLAASQGYNALTETQVTAEKVRNAGYQKSRWIGSGVPAQVDAERLERENAREM